MQFVHKHICKILIVVCLFATRIAMGASCPEDYTQSSVIYDSWGSDKKVVKIDGDGKTHCTEVSPNTDDDYRMRISYKCSDSNCVSNTYWFSVVRQKDKTTCSDINFTEAYHLERDLTSSSCSYKCVKGTKACNEFEKVFSNGNLTGYKLSGSDYNFSNASLLSSSNHANAYFDIKTDTTCEARAGKRGYIHVYSWRTAQQDNDSGMFVFGCGLQKSGLSNSSKHCSSGTLTWMAERAASGDVINGFKLNFNKNSTGRIKYECNTCEIGWKKNSAQTACEFCDDTKNFAGNGSYCGCKKGYYYNGSTCVPDTDANSHFSNIQNENGEYYCAQGYTVTDTPLPTNANNYVRYVCGCNTANGFIEDTEGCHCQTGYTINNMGDNNPENDTCVIDTDADYEDSTGWFKVGSNGSSCSGNWWEQQN